MKSTNRKGRKYLPVVFSILIAAGASTAMAQIDPLLDETEDVLNSQQLDVDGSFRRKSAADKLAQMRRKLEKKNEEMTRKKIEDERMKAEAKMTKKLQKMFQGQLQAMDEQPVVVQQAAPKVVAPAPVQAEPEKKIVEEVKIIPTLGVLNIQGENCDFESKINAGISVESMLTKRISVGLQFSYATMALTDVDQNNSSSYNYVSAPYNSAYYSTYGQGREIDYRQTVVGINSKFFLTEESRLRPYVGLGVNYNRASLKYTDQDKSQPYSYNNVYYGDEEYSSSYVSGSLLLGSEVRFTDHVGMVLGLNYSKGFLGGIDTQADVKSRYNNHDQQRLEGFGSDIEKAHFFAINAGLLVTF
ncbi:MAG: hypothetical protein KAQ98_11435 [Bacteriovoracaceae bacterium]|nr:hypothetical protein [Bacteriovoracaceae bacterium]